MLIRISDWIKTHKLVVLLALLILYLGSQSFYGVQPLAIRSSTLTGKAVAPSMGMGTTAADSFGKAESSFYAPSLPYHQDFAPTPDIANRLVVQNSYLSLLVSNVPDVRQKILSYTTSAGGYMVNAETSNPQDAPTANLTVRIPSEKLDATLETFRGWGVKVVSENLQGYDVTDQYVDIEARVATLEKTKRSMEALLDQAVQISDLTNLTREVINIQSQIDALKGSQLSLSENAKLAKLTVYLSTDELALPYAPSETFRPNVILKLAIRSLVTHLRQIGSLAIWVGVYAVIWVPLLLVAFLLNKRFSRKVS